jgi:hypothetical protein
MMGDGSDILKKRMLEALEKSLGVVTTACNKADIARQTHYRWMKEDPEYAAAVKDLENLTLDFGESQLHLLMKGVPVEGAGGVVYDTPPNTAAVIFFLKTKGKGRGYVESQEVIQYNPDKAPSWLDGDSMAPDKEDE